MCSRSLKTSQVSWPRSFIHESVAYNGITLAGYGLDQRRLAAAVWAEDGDVLVGADAQGEVVERDFLSAHHAQIVEVEQGRCAGHGTSSVCHQAYVILNPAAPGEEPHDGEEFRWRQRGRGDACGKAVPGGAIAAACCRKVPRAGFAAAQDDRVRWITLKPDDASRLSFTADTGCDRRTAHAGRRRNVFLCAFASATMC